MPRGVYVRTEETRRIGSLAKMGIRPSAESRRKMSESRRLNKNEKNLNWNDNEVGYKAIHMWIGKMRGKATKCENPSCLYPRRTRKRKVLLKPKRFQWASISRKAKRDVNDYIQLCNSCHQIYDKRKLTLKGLEKVIIQSHQEAVKTNEKEKN